jgi:hypothetical protein
MHVAMSRAALVTALVVLVFVDVCLALGLGALVAAAIFARNVDGAGVTDLWLWAVVVIDVVALVGLRRLTLRVWRTVRARPITAR